VLAGRFSWRTPEDEVYLAAVIPKWNNSVGARARVLASKGGLKSIRGWPVRWNHRVWETDRATRLDRMGSPAKWMREHYHSSLAHKAWSAARTCPSKLHFLFSCRRVSQNILGPDRFFWGKIHRKSNHALSERASERANRDYYWRIMQRYLPRTH